MDSYQPARPRWVVGLGITFLGLGLNLTTGAFAQAQTAPASTDPDAAPAQTAPQPPVVNSLDDYFNTWYDRVTYARATQPEWSSPLVTTTSMLEYRFRYETDFQHSGNGTDTTEVDGGKGLDLIVGDTEEIQVALPPYYIRTGYGKTSPIDGWNDWPVFRFKQRLLSSPADQGNYIVSAWLQVGVPIGISKLTNHSVTLSPTLGFGKGWGPFDIQGTIGALIPTAYEGKLGEQIQGNLAFQYNFLHYFWPQVEVNWTYYPDGPRAGLSQTFITPGFGIAKLELPDKMKFTIVVGCQLAVSPEYRAKPLTPAYTRDWIISTRLNF